jgi:hypothetical protein
MLARRYVVAVVSETAVTFHQLENQIGSIRKENSKVTSYYFLYLVRSRVPTTYTLPTAAG